MEIPFTPDELFTLARSRKREDIASRSILLALLIASAGACAYSLVMLSQPWLRLSQAWTLAWICFVLWRLRRVALRADATKSCATFLRTAYEGKRKGLLELRRHVFLLIPAIIAAWWGGGGAARLRAQGVVPSSRLYVFMSGPWPFLIAGFLLVLVWLALGFAARKATREIEELRQRTPF